MADMYIVKRWINPSLLHNFSRLIEVDFDTWDDYTDAIFLLYKTVAKDYISPQEVLRILHYCRANPNSVPLHYLIFDIEYRHDKNWQALLKLFLSQMQILEGEIPIFDYFMAFTHYYAENLDQEVTSPFRVTERYLFKGTGPETYDLVFQLPTVPRYQILQIKRSKPNDGHSFALIDEDEQLFISARPGKNRVFIRPNKKYRLRMDAFLFKRQIIIIEPGDLYDAYFDPWHSLPEVIGFH